MERSIGIKVLVTILIILIIVAGGLLTWKITQDKASEQVIAFGDGQVNEEEPKEENKEEEKYTPTIYSGDARPIAVMIDNHKSAMPQANLSKAYIVYEIIVEGGETRLMSLYKNQDLKKIGPIRSSRHYFLDYALENDAIYVHYGWSPQAQTDITKLSVNNINGITESTSSFWRVKDKSAPHNAVTDTESILKIANRKEYKTTSNTKPVLNYIKDEVDLGEVTEYTNVKKANEFSIEYSEVNTVKYEYDEENKNYIRYSRKTKQVDWDTKEVVTAKNIIITKVENTTLNDGENKGRQTLDNIGTFDGYYITNGKAIPIRCEKKSRKDQTIYKDLQGKEIKVNDGNTFIQICPIDANISFE